MKDLLHEGNCMQLLAVSKEQLKREFMIVSRQTSVNLLTKRRQAKIRCQNQVCSFSIKVEKATHKVEKLHTGVRGYRGKNKRVTKIHIKLKNCTP